MALQQARHSAGWSRKRWPVHDKQACAPFQFALSTRAGTDCVGHAVRVVTDHDPEMTVVWLHIVRECEQKFSVKQLFFNFCQHIVDGQTEEWGSPCSPPSCCPILWLTPSSSNHQYVDARVYVVLTNGNMVRRLGISCNFDRMTLMNVRPSVWSHEGIKILGTPVGFVQRLCEECIAKEVQLWQAIACSRSSKLLHVPARGAT